jgi:excisionase family DNA binding protein
MTKPKRSPLAADTKNDPYLTVAEMADAARVSKMTIYRIIHSGRLKTVRVGSTFRARRSAFEAAINTTAAGPQPDTLGQKLRIARLASGFTQAYLATKMGSTRYLVARAELENRGDREFWEAADRTLGLGGTLVAEFDQAQQGT